MSNPGGTTTRCRITIRAYKSRSTSTQRARRDRNRGSEYSETLQQGAKEQADWAGRRRSMRQVSEGASKKEWNRFARTRFGQSTHGAEGAGSNMGATTSLSSMAAAAHAPPGTNARYALRTRAIREASHPRGADQRAAGTLLPTSFGCARVATAHRARLLTWQLYHRQPPQPLTPPPQPWILIGLSP